MEITDILSVTLILLSVIDIIGNLPVVISMKKNGIYIDPAKVSLVSALIMIAFLFGGNYILKIIGIDVESFAIAGAIIIFIIGAEMVLGVSFFKNNPNSRSTSIVPIAFPMIAGSGTLTTIISLRAEYSIVVILLGILINIILVYLALKSSGWIQRKIGVNGTEIIKKVFGVILLSIAIKLFRTNIGI